MTTEDQHWQRLLELSGRTFDLPLGDAEAVQWAISEIQRLTNEADAYLALAAHATEDTVETCVRMANYDQSQALQRGWTAHKFDDLDQCRESAKRLRSDGVPAEGDTP
jgi:aminoglycoside phosphotransferase family enzyme